MTPDAYEPDVLQGITVKQLLVPLLSSDKTTGMPYLYTTDDVGFAAEMMGKYHTSRLLVLENKETGKVCGIITSTAILGYYSRQKQKEHTYHSPGRTRRMLVQGRKLFQRGRNFEKHM
jgi:hypothetical protein